MCSFKSFLYPLFIYLLQCKCERFYYIMHFQIKSILIKIKKISYWNHNNKNCKDLTACLSWENFQDMSPFLDDVTCLKEYELERQKNNIPTMLIVDGLHRLYNSSFTPLVLLRSLGLQATHALNPLKVSDVNTYLGILFNKLLSSFQTGYCS